ncbi:MAG: lysylphosphatidylglycerol synthase transmembrane domain-containing protein [Pseudomonadota bacterium]
MSRVVKFTLAVALLALTFGFTGVWPVIHYVNELHIGWLMAGLVLTLPQYVLSAARWCLVANAIGAELSYRESLSRYYLAGFLNTTLPSGIVGEATRVALHGRALRTSDDKPYRRALFAVLVERSIGQCALLTVLLLVLVIAPPTWFELSRWTPLTILAGLIALGLTLIWIRPDQRLWIGRSKWLEPLGQFARALVVSHTPWTRAVVQFAMSTLILSTYLGVFAASAYAVGAHPNNLLTLGLITLGAMVVPFSVLGFGVREASAAGLWAYAGADPAEGVAISVVYGCINIVASLPGALYAISAARRTAKLPAD